MTTSPKTLLTIGIVAAMFITFVVLRLGVGDGEDTWLCRNGQWIKIGNPSQPMPTEHCPTHDEILGFTNTQATLTEPTEADDRFGFLVGPDPREYAEARAIGAGWIRPHPGPFIWGRMQTSATSPYDFSETDTLVKDAQQAGVKVLVTLWPYAAWDQESRADNSHCQVSGEEFVKEFGQFRCPPNHLKEYQGWVSAVVERYDGDGIGDMPSLTTPVTHWEVMNEPDLAPPDNGPGLRFFMGTPEEYADLLTRTSGAVRAADSNATILIAGAAGGNEQFMDFYREVFAVDGVAEAFDIANVHCISNDDVESFNVEPYAAMLAEFGINKPIWVTEAEAFISSDVSVIAAQLEASSRTAFTNGTEKIFYTSMDLGHQPGSGGKTVSSVSREAAIQEAYRDIFRSLTEAE